jgi:glycosyltransferase involved in cell wall biosynthesis
MVVTMNRIEISVVVPVYSGREYLSSLLEALRSVRESWTEKPFQLLEVVFVDDASKDDSAQLLEQLAVDNDWVQVITLSRNFGQHAATAAGILHTCGQWVATLDEDLQHDPNHIEVLLRKAVLERSDVVYAKPTANVHAGFFRNWSSRTYKWILSKVTGNDMVKSFNSFRLIRGSIARAASSVLGHDTYLDMTLCWFTDKYSVASLSLTDYRHRKQGKSGYSFRSLLSHARRALISSQVKYLRLAVIIGLVGMLFALINAAWLLWEYSSGSVDVKGFSTLFITILFFGGVSSFLLSVLLEYTTNVMMHSQGKPLYFSLDRSSDMILRDYFERAQEPVPTEDK